MPSPKKKEFDWQTQTARRIGLTRNSYVTSIHGSNSVSGHHHAIQDAMLSQTEVPAGKSPKVRPNHENEQPLKDEDLMRSPESGNASDGSSHSLARSNFARVEKVSPLPMKNPFNLKGGNERGTRRRGTTASSTKPITAYPVSSQSSIISSSSESPKRKSQEDLDEVRGRSRRLEFDGTSVKANKRPKVNATYSKKTAVKALPPTKSIEDTATRPSTRREFQKPSYDIGEDNDGVKSKSSTPKKFKPPQIPPLTPSPAKQGKKKNIKLDSSLKPIDINSLGSERPAILDNSNNGAVGSGFREKIKTHKKQSAAETLPTMQAPKFEKFELGIDIPDALLDMLPEDIATQPKTKIEDEKPDSSREGRCPMCKRPVDRSTLESFGKMNIQQQERFCHDHRKTTAKAEYRDRDYPEIDWENISSRISKYRPQIEAWVCGEDCHYRRVLGETVQAGKERNLLQTTANLTPGYYGSRGLGVISGLIMDKFTALLKKQAVKDKLLIARGVGGFVQSVLVLEVATLLIMEDLSIDKEKARDVLLESSTIGDLVHEEICDVVEEPAEDSDDNE